MTHPRAFVITLRTTPAERWERERKHLEERGIVAEPFYGMDASVSGLETRFLYERDHPGTGFKVGSKLVCLYLSHYLLYRVLEQLLGDVFWIMEDDAEWDADWAVRWEEAFYYLPKDWDLCWTGSCCAGDKPKTLIAGNLWEVKYPLCTHSYAVRKKALPVLSQVLERIYAPLDVALADHAMRDAGLKTYTILPRLCGQFNTLIAP